jgi:hypothetical protein
MDGNKTVDASFSNVPSHILTVTGSGAGSGIITSDIYGINCISTAGVESGICSVLIPDGTPIVLTATATIGIFNGWSGGGCSGVGTCSIVIGGDVTIDASFLFSSISSYLGFVPWHLAIDGNYIYVCGQQVYTVGGVGYYGAAVMKIDKNTLLVIDQFNLIQATNNVNNYFDRVYIDGNDVYLVGSCFNTGYKRAVVTKRDKNNFTIEHWTNYYLLSGINNNYAIDCVADASYLYVAGDYNDAVNHLAAFRYKLNKSDGSTVWSKGAIYSDYDGIVDIGSYIVIAGSAGGVRFLDKVDKVANTSVQHGTGNYAWDGVVYYGGNYYVCGLTYTPPPPPYWYRVSVAEYSGLFTLIWEWDKNYHPIPPATDHVEELLNCVTDGSSLYSIGLTSYGPLPFYYVQAIVAKIGLDGSYIWDFEHGTPYRGAYRAIGLLDANTFVIGTFNNNGAIAIVNRYGYLEKRSTLTGAII